MKHILLIALILLMSDNLQAQCPVSKAFTNPVIAGFFPDPSVVRVGDDYFCVNSTFEYFPAIVISHSRDLVNWKQIGHLFTKSEDLDLTHFFDAMGIWAPGISIWDVNAKTRRIMVNNPGYDGLVDWSQRASSNPIT